MAGNVARYGSIESKLAVPSCSIYIIRTMKNIQSIFYAHYNRLTGIQCPISLKEAILDLTNRSEIKEIDKRRIKLDVCKLSSLVQLQRYLTNSMLKYQGMGLKWETIS